jgi:hypothetical protein
MARLVDLDDLIDTSGVADVLGLANRNHVSDYRRRYPGFPTPVAEFNSGRCLLWLRSDIEAWNRDRS